MLEASELGQSRVRAIILGAFCCVSSWIGGEAKAANQPNVILLVADDLGYGDLGFQGCRDIPTPHIDALAQGGVRCSNAYVSGPYCSPTRAGMLTGRYQQRFGHEFNPNSPGTGLPTSEETIAGRLDAEGYTTGLVGKWHLGSETKYHPVRRGFQEFYGFLAGAHPYLPGQGAPIFRDEAEFKETDYLTDAIGREALNFIDRHKGDSKPFFLEVAFNAVHTPMQATEERLKRFASIEDPTRRTYAAMLSAMDDAVGAIVGRIREAGLEGSTLIIFLSDNGGPTMPGTTINGSSNAPLRGSKRTTLEGGIRVPFVWSWKGVLPAGVVYDKPIIQLDILPTVMAAAGAEALPEWSLDGLDLLPYLKGEREGTPHERLFWRLGAQMAIRHGDWKLVRYDETVDRPSDGPSRPANITVTAPRLYHLPDDAGEARDLASEHPEKVRDLMNAWKSWSDQMVKPLWGPTGQPVRED